MPRSTPSAFAGTSGIDPYFSGEDALRWLREALSQAVQVRIAVAYIDEVGVEELRAAIGSRLDAGDDVRCQLLYGEPDNGLEDREVLSRLHKLHELYPNRFEARRLPSRRGAAFHPKVYLITLQNGDLHLLLGSSNLTNAGLGANTEGNLVSPTGGRWVEKVQAQFNRWWRSSVALPEMLGGPGREAPGEMPLISRPISWRLEESLASGLTAEFTVQPGSIWLRLPRELLNLQEDQEVNGELLNVRTRSDLRLRLVSEDTVRSIDNLRAWVLGRLRSHSLNTSWGRFVPKRGLSALDAERSTIEKRINETLANTKEAVNSLDSELDDAVRAEFLALWQILHGGDSKPMESTVARIVALAHEARSRTKVFDRLRSGMRLRIFPVPVPVIGGAYSAEIVEKCEADWKEDLRRFAITAASAPRRSLLKYRNPQIAWELCPLDDPWIEIARQHQWKLAPGSGAGATDQRSLFDGKTLSDIEATIQRQIDEVEGWHALPFDDVMQRYGELIKPLT